MKYIKYILKFYIPLDIQWDVWDEEVYEYWSLWEVLEKIRRSREERYSVYKLIMDVQREYEEVKKELKQRPESVTVTLELDTEKLDKEELDILMSFLKKGVWIKVVIDGAKIGDNLQNLLSLAKKANTSVKVNITDDVYNILQT